MWNLTVTVSWEEPSCPWRLPGLDAVANLCLAATSTTTFPIVAEATIIVAIPWFCLWQRDVLLSPCRNVVRDNIPTAACTALFRPLCGLHGLVRGSGHSLSYPHAPRPQRQPTAIPLLSMAGDPLTSVSALGMTRYPWHQQTRPRKAQVCLRCRGRGKCARGRGAPTRPCVSRQSHLPTRQPASQRPHSSPRSSSRASVV